MKLAIIESRIVNKIHCPHCGEPTSTIDHALAEAEKAVERKEAAKKDPSGVRIYFGPWYCDLCNKGYVGEIRWCAEDEMLRVYLEKRKGERHKTIVLLQSDDVLLLCSGSHIVDPGVKIMPSSPFLSKEHKSKNRYFYEEHTCPVNYLRDVESVLFVSGDGSIEGDPHGLFDYVDTVADDREEWMKKNAPGSEWSNCSEDWIKHAFPDEVVRLWKEKRNTQSDTQ